MACCLVELPTCVDSKRWQELLELEELNGSGNIRGENGQEMFQVRTLVVGERKLENKFGDGPSDRWIQVRGV